ncbi:augmin subunit 6 [Tanacetum coccineum]|uniref:Augmin subunit 6 n=1 Tax=Tanacetum coccineum TaxID=301880 RepID=A0ABQ5EZQ9_9ASTR
MESAARGADTQGVILHRLTSLAKCYGDEVGGFCFLCGKKLELIPVIEEEITSWRTAIRARAHLQESTRIRARSAETGYVVKLAHRMTQAEYVVFELKEAYYLHARDGRKLHDLRNSSEMEVWRTVYELGLSSFFSFLPRCSGPHHRPPLRDLIAHSGASYRISGSSLLAAMDESTQVSSSNLDKDQADRSQAIVNRENVNESLSTCHSQTNNEKSSWIDDRSGRGQPTVDIAEVLRRWTHVLQRIHKQSLHLAKANDGEGPDLLRSANDGGTSGHAESLAATLAEHRQHLANLAFSVRICVSFLRGDIIILFTLVPAQVLVNQLKGVAPAIQNSISELSSTAKSGNFYKKHAQVDNNQMDNVSENLLHKQTVPNSQRRTGFVSSLDPEKKAAH